MKINLKKTETNIDNIKNIVMENLFFSEAEAKKQYEYLKKVNEEGCSKSSKIDSASDAYPNGLRGVGFRFIKHFDNEIVINGYIVKEQSNKTLEKSKIGKAYKFVFKAFLDGNKSYVEGVYQNTLSSKTILRIHSVDVDEKLGTVAVNMIGRSANINGALWQKISLNKTQGTLFYNDNEIVNNKIVDTKTVWNPCNLTVKKDTKSVDDILNIVSKTFDLSLDPVSIEDRNKVWTALLEKYPDTTGLCLNGDMTANTRNPNGNYVCGYKYAEHSFDPSKPSIEGVKVNKITIYGIACINNKDKNVDTDSLAIINKIEVSLTENNILSVGKNENNSESQTVLTSVYINSNDELEWFFEGPAKVSTFRNGSGVSSEINTLSTSSNTFFNINPRGSTSTSVEQTTSNKQFTKCIFKDV